MCVLYTVSHLTFACYSAACRPPGKNGGTGGSLKGGPHDSPISPAARKAMRALKGEADALANDVNDPSARNTHHPDGTTDLDRMEPRVTAFGQKVHAALEKVLDEDKELVRLRDEYRSVKELLKTHGDRQKEIGEQMRQMRVTRGDREFTPEERARYDKLGEEDDAVYKLRNDLNRKQRQIMVDGQQRRASVIGQALNEIVPMGGEVAGVGRHRTSKKKVNGMPTLSVNEMMTYTAKVYPKAWIEHSNDWSTQPHDRPGATNDAARAYKLMPLTFRKTQSRAHYADTKVVTSSSVLNKRMLIPLRPDTTLRDYKDEAAKNAVAVAISHSEVTLDNDLGTAVHEYGHRMEHMFPTVALLENAFLRRRAGSGATPQPLGKPYRSTEQHLPDGLFDRYAEKVYKDDYREVFTMGWEYYVTNKTSSDRTTGGRPDPEHMGLVLGMITTVRQSSGRQRKFTLR